MIRATNVKRGRIVMEGLVRVNVDSIPASRNPYLQVGDIIVVRSGAYTGDAAMVTKVWEGAIAGYDLIVTPSNELDSMYCSQFILSDIAQRYFRSQRVRSAQPHINAQQLAETAVLFPPMHFQRDMREILLPD